MQEKATGIKSFKAQPLSLTEQASRIIANAILEGELKGGEQLIESKLQKQFSISRSPIREAFRDLEKKGLVVIVPRKGVFVKTITLKDVQEHYPVQGVLEGLAAREACFKMTSEDLDEMEQELERMIRATKPMNVKAFQEHHELFHSIFIAASGNEVLINLIRNLRLQGIRYRYFHKHTEEYCRESISIHRRILDLFRNKKQDPDEIERTVRNHIQVFGYGDGWDL
jgi:DNA-binding GntR family transcriptional regulator